MKIKVKDKELQKNLEKMESILNIEFFEVRDTKTEFFLAFVDNKNGLCWRTAKNYQEELLAIMDDLTLCYIASDDDAISFVPYEYNPDASCKEIQELRRKVKNKIKE